MPANAGINERIGCQYQGMAGTLCFYSELRSTRCLSSLRSRFSRSKMYFLHFQPFAHSYSRTYWYTVWFRDK